MGKKTKVLLVDDDEQVVDRLRQTLGDDYEVATLNDWDDLSRFFFQDRCFFVLVDINLPMMRGDVLLEILKTTAAKSGGPRPALVYYSSAEDDVMEKLARETGADGYISKRTVGEKLKEAIAALLEPRGRRSGT